MSNFSFLIHSQSVFHNDFSAHTFQSDIWGAPTFEIQGNSRKLKLIPLVRGGNFWNSRKLKLNISQTLALLSKEEEINIEQNQINIEQTQINIQKNSNKYLRNVKLDISQKLTLASTVPLQKENEINILAIWQLSCHSCNVFHVHAAVWSNLMWENRVGFQIGPIFGWSSSDRCSNFDQNPGETVNHWSVRSWLSLGYSWAQTPPLDVWYIKTQEV